MEDIDFNLQKGGVSASRTKHFNFANPGPLPEELTDVPGFVMNLTDKIMCSSHSPNRTLAFAGALAMLAHLAGRTFSDGSGTRTNLYVIALAPSGSGKEAPRRINNQLAKSLGISESLMESVASGEALEDELVKMPSLLNAATCCARCTATKRRSDVLSRRCLSQRRSKLRRWLKEK